MKFSSSAPSSSNFYDIVIVGGGLVGNAMACSIGLNETLKSQKVLLLESGKPKSLGTPPNEYSNRVSAISPASIRLFKKLGIWDRLKQYRTSSVTDLYVLDSCSRSRIRFERLNSNEEIAYIVENDAIISSLYDVIRERCGNVTIRAGSSMKNCVLTAGLTDLVSLTLADESSIETSLIIGADGQKSKVREEMGVEYTGWNYEQMGLVATLRINTDSANTIAWQRFTPFGPIALLPLSQEYSSLVWTTTVEDAKRLLALPPDQFVDELNHYL
uniref:FAD-binding domain-containing protein n=1 Tax=Acrobeloides nanus TaxID=290746 RepID=A0A914CRT5_9BILA